MKQRIINDLTQAIKAQDKEKLPVIRGIKGAIQLEEIEKQRELNDDEVITVISKQIKMRKESLVEFEKGNRSDLVEATNKEIKILEAYLPEQLTEEELNNIIDKVFEEVKPSSIKDMGKVMTAVTPLVRGKADMGVVSGKIKAKLN